MAIELAARGIPFERERSLPIVYKSTILPCNYRADFVCMGSIIVELKAIQKISAIEQAQVIHYLRATGFPRALLLNFGAPRLEYERMVHNYHLRSSA